MIGPVRRTITAILLVVVLAAAVLALGGCGGNQVQDAAPRSKESQPSQALQTQKVSIESGGSYTNVGAKGLAKMLERKGFLLVNVHVPYEGEIAQTDRLIPHDRVGSNPDGLPADKDAKVVLYCRSGSMSAIAARELVGSGYTNLWNLEGGMIAWRQAGYPLIKRQR